MVALVRYLQRWKRCLTHMEAGSDGSSPIFEGWRDASQQSSAVEAHEPTSSPREAESGALLTFPGLGRSPREFETRRTRVRFCAGEKHLGFVEGATCQIPV